jgi:hypothetical protein
VNVFLRTSDGAFGQMAPLPIWGSQPEANGLSQCPIGGKMNLRVVWEKQAGEQRQRHDGAVKLAENSRTDPVGYKPVEELEPPLEPELPSLRVPVFNMRRIAVWLSTRMSALALSFTESEAVAGRRG